MKGDQIRESFIRFFEGKGHLYQPGASLIPAGDPTLLFTSAGMVPFKPFFMGEQTPPAHRLTSSQKSFRTADIEEVGDTKHLTFFEMLGNFSIGDYFKKQAIGFAWELLTQVFELSSDRLFITIHLDDDESFLIWRNEIGVAEEKIYRYGAKDNWWGPAGTEGPNGPCSEIHYDRGKEKGCGSLMNPIVLSDTFKKEILGKEQQLLPGCHPNCNCGRFVELWNLVFMQYYQNPQGNRTLLPAPSVDTGLGLERIAAILQNKSSVYETDLLWPIIEKTCELSCQTYGVDPSIDYALRVVSEHARATSFLIGDGVVPANEGRGYVLRRIIRRAIRYGHRIGLDRSFLSQVAESVLTRFHTTFPELLESHDFILKVISIEEERFGQTMQNGLQLLETKLHESTGILSGQTTFQLWDTHGFPAELSQEIAQEHGITVDMEGFETEMMAQRDRARNAQSFSGGMGILSTYDKLNLDPSMFVGYDNFDQESVIIALLIDNIPCDYASKGQQVEIVLQQTPFYAQSGGQIGDRGSITGPNGLVTVEDTQRPIARLIIHRGVVDIGDISVGDVVRSQVNVTHRMDATRNHSGTHLLHASLRAVLGPHVRQAGSLVTSERLRFDFSHVSSLSLQEQLSIQALSNQKVRDNLLVSAHETTYTEAVREGALAFFGDKYGDVVRVVKMSNGEAFSLEVCGGTHVAATGQLGTIIILGEVGIGGGMRRLEAVTGAAAEQLFIDQNFKLTTLSDKLQVPMADLEAKLDSFLQDTTRMKRKLMMMERNILRVEAEDLLSCVLTIEGVNLVVGRTSASSSDGMREMCDFLKAKLQSAVVVLGAIVDSSPLLVAMVTSDLVIKGLHAGDIVRNTANLMGGGGGGNPYMAQAGGKDVSKLDEALRGVPNLVRNGLLT
jgi:alanyl-tRNA synthetase